MLQKDIAKHLARNEVFVNHLCLLFNLQMQLLAFAVNGVGSCPADPQMH